MQDEDDLCFAIPTYPLRDVGETVEQYDEHFWRNGHSPRIFVFDDSTPTNQEKYFPLLGQTKTHQDLFYVGPREKEQFLTYLNSRLRDKRLESLVKSLFRPSYGGNRNYTLMYTLGGLMISSDDDMRPYTLVEHSPESLGDDEVCRGRLHKADENGYTRKSFDITAAFLDVLGKPVSEVPDNYERGELLVDTAMDLETNASKGLSVPDDYRVKMAQTFRSGTNDIDATDFLEMFLEDEEQTSLDTLNDLYVLVNFRPAVTRKNWRMDCGVAGYDNTFVAVLYTSVHSTLAALREAGNLASHLGARITLMVPEAVPYAVSLETPPVLVEFNEHRFRVLANQSSVETNVQIYLCRDRFAALQSVLKPGSIVILGGRKRWWPTRDERLARDLRGAGYEVIFKETE